MCNDILARWRRLSEHCVARLAPYTVSEPLPATVGYGAPLLHVTLLVNYRKVSVLSPGASYSNNYFVCLSFKPLTLTNKYRSPKTNEDLNDPQSAVRFPEMKLIVDFSWRV